VRWGFGSAGAFSRAFRNQYGCTPREYRKARQAVVAADAGSRGVRVLRAGGVLVETIAGH
jgi:AraC-like DNA-binding protein